MCIYMHMHMHMCMYVLCMLCMCMCVGVSRYSNTAHFLLCSRYILDYARWGTRAVIKVMDAHSAQTLSEGVLAEGCEEGTYYTFRVPSARSLLLRLHQVLGSTLAPSPHTHP